jgi:sulfatase maturation enzyme AslB (radical SAM superfamily)
METIFTQLYGLAREHFSRGRFSQAKEALEKLKGTHADDYRLMCLLSEVNIELENYAEAGEVLSRAEDLHKNNAWVYKVLGSYNLTLDKKEAAHSYFDKALKCSDNDKEKSYVYFEMARVYNNKKEKKKAFKYIKEAIRLYPDYKLYRDYQENKIARIKYSFLWLIHLICNYKCNYCFNTEIWDLIEGEYKYVPAEDWVKAWERVYSDYGEFEISISGGEPFIYKGFTDVLLALSKISYITINTNFSCGKKELDIIADKVDPSRVEFFAGFHPDHADFNTYIKNIAFLKDNGFHCQVNYVTYPGQIDKMDFYKEVFEEMGVNFVPSPFKGTYHGRVYPESFNQKEKKYMVECLVDNARPIGEKKADYIEKRINFVKSKNKLCRAGYDFALVNYDGAIYPCVNNFKRKIGNIFDDDFETFPEPERCQCEVCPCYYLLLLENS